jgi:hypothetical protein
MRLASFGFPIEALYVLCKVRNESLYVMPINFTIQGATINFIFFLKQIVTRAVRMNRIMFWITINFQDKKISSLQNIHKYEYSMLLNNKVM